MEEHDFTAPIPGEGLTAEPGGRPWLKPPQYNTVEEALDYYVPRINQDDFERDLIDTMELGIPLTTMANTIQISGVMQGLHTVDVGLLLIPVLMEMLAFIGDRANVTYKMGTDKPKRDSVSDARYSIALKKMQEEEGKGEEEEEMPMDISEPSSIPESTPEPSGLMARRV
tara:strand:- start:2328 stop:2837 length:510 start_codon:yes stop_codon:yes gene_type:complete